MDKIKITNGKAWVNALRNGGYEQCTETLYKERTDSFCCLGVYCHVVKNCTEEDLLFNNVPSDVGVYLTEDKSCKILEEVFVSLNDEVDWNISCSDFANKVGLKREKKQYTFEEIADFIEENFEID